jgi:RHH-type rel operon transcriptional repressor/antitoxin RelB
VVSINLDPEMEERLSQLAKKTGRSVSFFAREAIEQHMEDLEDYFLGMEALKNPGRIYTPDEAKRELGL